jgi:hypothetical protein
VQPPSCAEQAICRARAYAEEEGRRLPDDKASFTLARKLRALGEAHPTVYEEAVRAFCEKTGRPFDEFWLSFGTRWDKVRYAEGEGAFNEAAAKAKSGPLLLSPPWGKPYTFVASLAWYLSEQSESGTFFLPRKLVGGLLGVSAQSATRAVQLLEREKVIECVDDEYRYGRDAKAKTYRFIGRPPAVVAPVAGAEAGVSGEPSR